MFRFQRLFYSVKHQCTPSNLNRSFCCASLASGNPKIAPEISSASVKCNSSDGLNITPGTSEVITLWGSYRIRGQRLQELRNNGMIPGMVSDYHMETGNQYNDYIALQRKEIWGHLTRLGRKEFMSRFYNLELREHPDSDKIDKVIKVFPSKLYLIQGRRSILNLAFIRVRRNVKLRMSIPLKFRGRTVCPGLIKGGTLVVLKNAVSIFVLPDEIPPYIEVDVSKLQIGERILLNDLDLDLQYKGQAGLVVCEVKKYRSVKRKCPEAVLDFGIPRYRF